MEVVKRVQNAERGFCDKRSAVLTHTADGFGDPHRIAGEQLVVFGRAQMACHTQLHNEIVDDLLNLLLSTHTGRTIPFKIDIKEGHRTAKAHSCAVLLLDGAEICKIQPLYRLQRILGRLGNIISVHCRHILELFEKRNLLIQLFQTADFFCVDIERAETRFVLFLFRNQAVDTVQRNAPVVTDDASAAVCVRKTGDNTGMPCRTDGFIVDTEHTVVVRRTECKFLFDLIGQLISVCLARFPRHIDAAEWVDGTLERHIGLQTDDNFIFPIQITGCEGAE